MKYCAKVIALCRKEAVRMLLKAISFESIKSK